MTRNKTMYGKAAVLATLLVSSVLCLPAMAAQSADKGVAKSPAAEARNETRVRAAKLIGAEIHNPAGEKLGKLTDLLIDLSKGEVRYAIVEFGGALGVGEKLFAFPLVSFGASSESDKFVLNIDREKLKSAPGFSRNNSTDWAKFENSLDRYFGINQPAPTKASRNLHLATQIIGVSNVLDKNGSKVGTVTDMVMKRGDGRIEYLVMALDRGIDSGQRLLPLPLTAFYFGHSGGPPVLDIPPQRLDKQFAFDDSRWPNINDTSYQQNLGVYMGRVTQGNPSPTPPNNDRAAPSRKMP